MDNAISRMEARKKAGKKYYRFVGRDIETPPGTGAKIYEWVKTVNRNKGCPKDFPPQHYEKLPLILL